MGLLYMHRDLLLFHICTRLIHTAFSLNFKMMHMLWSGDKADKNSNKLAGVTSQFAVMSVVSVAMVEHQPHLLGPRFDSRRGCLQSFSVSAKASLPISLSPSPSSPFRFSFDLLLALEMRYSHSSHVQMSIFPLVKMHKTLCRAYIVSR